MSSWYTVKLGGYTFTAAPGINLEIEDVIRTNVSPNVRVAANYTWTLPSRVRAADSAAAVAAMQAAFAAMVNARILPTTLEIENAAGTDLDQIGDVGVTATEGWEDLRVTSFQVNAVDGQLVAGAYFTLGFAARKTYPDTNGICEFEQNYVEETGSSGQEVRRLVTTIRLALRYTNGVTASNTITGTTAIAEQLRLAAPSGWLRTKGNNTRGFEIEYPSYPLRHVATTTSEVTEATGSAGSTAGAVEAEVVETVEFDPSRGISRRKVAASTSGNANAVGWVEAQEPANDLVSREIEGALAGGDKANGEWKSVEAISPSAGASSKVTRVHRRFALRGGGRRAGVVEMSGGIAARVQIGPFVATRLREEVDVFAQGPAALEQVTIPPPLSGDWVLDGDAFADIIGIAEDALASSQRLWLRTVTREYLWLGTDDPLASPELNAALTASMTESLS